MRLLRQYEMALLTSTAIFTRTELIIGKDAAREVAYIEDIENTEDIFISINLN